jgi:hypothetical protein
MKQQDPKDIDPRAGPDKPSGTQGPANTISGIVRGNSAQAGRDIHYDHSTHRAHDAPNPWAELFLGSGPGRLFMAIGVIIALAGFGGWMYLILDAGALDDPSVNPFDATIFGLPAPMVAFGSAAVGTVISNIGLGMSRAARQRRELEGDRRRAGRRSR